MRYILFVVLISIASISSAQCPMQWPQDPLERELTRVLLTDITENLRNKNYWGMEDRISILEDLIGPADTIYVFKHNLFVRKIDIQDDDLRAKRSEALAFIKSWDANCGQSLSSMGKKVYSSYRLGVRDGKDFPIIFIENLKLSKALINRYSILTPDYLLFVHSVNVFYAHRYANLPSTKTFSEVERIDSLITQKEIRNPELSRSLEQARKIINTIDYSGPQVDCAWIIERLGTRFKERPTRELAKVIFKSMLDARCTDDPLWTEAGKYIVSDPPNFMLLYNLTLKSISRGDIELAKELALQALDYAESQEERRMAEELLERIKLSSLND